MMRPKVITKKIAAKHCPSCEQQIPVACKTCTCGHRFTKTSTSSAPSVTPQASKEKPEILEPTASTTTIGTRRRTERVKRERPNFYDSLEYITPPTRRRRTTSASASQSSEGETSGKKRIRGRPKPLKTKQPKDEDSNDGSSSTSSRDKEQDMFANISADKAFQFAVILREINRKYTTQNFKP